MPINTLKQYSSQSKKSTNVMQLGVKPVGGMTIQGSARFIINAIGTPDYRIDSESEEMKQFFRICADIRAENSADIAVINKIQLLVAQLLNMTPTEEGILGRDYSHPSRDQLNARYINIQQHNSFFWNNSAAVTAPLSAYIKNKTADCRVTNLLFASGLYSIGFDVKWLYVQPQRAYVDRNGKLTELEEPEDHAVVLWQPDMTSASPVVLDAYFSEYHGYQFNALQNGIDRSTTKRYSQTDSNGRTHTLKLYHVYEKHHGGETNMPDRVHDDQKNFSGLWKVLDYPKSQILEEETKTVFHV